MLSVYSLVPRPLPIFQCCTLKNFFQRATLKNWEWSGYEAFQCCTLKNLFQRATLKNWEWSGYEASLFIYSLLFIASVILNTMTVVIDVLVVGDKTTTDSMIMFQSQSGGPDPLLGGEGSSVVAYSELCWWYTIILLYMCMHTKYHSHSLPLRCAYASFNAP